MSAPTFPFNHLVVVHYHWRPGGVRRVVELTLPAIASAAEGLIRRITIIGGGNQDEHPDLNGIRQPITFLHEPAFDYFSGNEANIVETAARIRKILHRAMPETDSSHTLIWLQNPALARNAILCREITNFSRESNAAILLHHHDFWCAGRWTRWKELQQCGCNDLANAAKTLFTVGTRSAHLGINLRDCQTLQKHLPDTAFYLPNPLQGIVGTTPEKIASARKWLEIKLCKQSPLWIYPTRFLRRKNLLEAILLTRWLRPDALLATTSGRFSPDEAEYASDIVEAASEQKWMVHFGLLDKPGAPRVEEILPLAETVLHTSVQEGFGMGFVESAAAGTPLIARAIPGVMPDLANMGFAFPQLYNDIEIPPMLFNVDKEIHRQAHLYENARQRLPEPFQAMFPDLIPQQHGTFFFSRLTRNAQLEILENSPDVIQSACASLNPSIEKIRIEGMQPTPWPAQFTHTPARYAYEFLRIASMLPTAPLPDQNGAANAQMEIAAVALSAGSIFPLQLE